MTKVSRKTASFDEELNSLSASNNCEDDSSCAKDGDYGGKSNTNLSSTDDSNHDHDDDNKKQHWYDSKDTLYVFFWLFVVLVTIGITASIVLSLTNRFLQQQEENEFKNAFQQQANVISEAISFHAKMVIGSFESMSDTITSYTKASDTSDWPFVTIPDFARRGQRALVDAKIEMIAFSPLVTYEQKDGWSVYSSYEDSWLGSDNVNMTTTTMQQPNQHIFRVHEETGLPVPDDNILMVPMWLSSPKPHNTSVINFNLLSDSLYYFLFNAMMESNHVALSAVYQHQYLYDHLFAPGQHQLVHKSSRGGEEEEQVLVVVEEEEEDSHSSLLQADNFPHSILMAPVYDSFNISDQSLAGIIHGVLPWDKYLTELLPPGAKSINCVLKNSCGQSYTFEINGPEATFLGEGDLHDTSYDHMAQQIDFGSDFLGLETRTYRQCFYSLTVYPTKEFEEHFESNEETVRLLCLVAGVLTMLAVFFFVFFFFVQRRQQKVMGVAIRTTKIISELFPDNVRDRIMTQAEDQAHREFQGAKTTDDASVVNLKTLLIDGQDPSDDSGPPGSYRRTSMILHPGRRGSSTTSLTLSSLAGSRGSVGQGVTIFEDAPIADLYPNCTVIFADIVGFTAWSSTRDPSQVFVLLETLYSAFDVIAKRRRIFKVETIGDCYVACTGLPKPRADHAVAMARFANDVLVKSSEVFHLLEIQLGPGTSSLNMRLGLHSGPVTAGVLRGEKGRFQLFGDTVNTAARMESNSKTGKIHCSQETANLLIASGKKRWVTERADKIHAKGKGELTTYFLHVRSGDMESVSHISMTSGSSDVLIPSADPFFSGAQSSKTSIVACSGESRYTTLHPCKKTLSVQHARLVDWNVELLAKLLKNVVASRKGKAAGAGMLTLRKLSEPHLIREQGKMPLDEWAQAIELPENTSKKQNKKGQSKRSDVELPEKVMAQLSEFVATIACLHADNPFHNFDHASHVTMSVNKLLLRVIQSEESSFRIASDPLTHFAAVMSALWHDIDHKGVPNAQLMKEEPALAVKYGEKSAAEQHAIDLSWDLLMEDRFIDLRNTIYTTQGELQRFRTVLVNSILATDIMDKDLKNLRSQRWNLAFSSSEGKKDQAKLGEDRDMYRASCVLEQLIQASDVSHTMQHWHVYRSWNERLFQEMYQAYREGRSEKDPSEFWYQGELGFFDFYILPLAKRLAEVGVFGVSSSEYLDFALKNRAEWEVKGKQVVAEYMERIVQKEEGSPMGASTSCISGEVLHGDGSGDVGGDASEGHTTTTTTTMNVVVDEVDC